jgi:ribosomal protein S18 acetylase RimI-like enzyme
MLEKGDEAEVIALMEKDLTSKKVSFNADNCISDPNVHCLVVEDETNKIIVGHGALVVTMVPSKGRIGILHDIVVADNCRGQGLGRLLVSKLVNIADALGLSCIDLTSNPQRVAARKLYESFGFVLLNTGVFRLQI